MQTIIVLILNVIVGALANVFLKIGTMRLPDLTYSNIIKIVGSPFIIFGVLLFILNFPLYSFVLQKMKLGVAFPLVTSLTFIMVVLISAFYFKEWLNWIQYLGLILLITGLWLLAR